MRGPRRDHVPDRPRHDGPGTGIQGAHRELHGFGERQGLRNRAGLLLRPDPGPPLIALRGAGSLVVPGVRVHRDGRPLHHRILHHAPEEEPGHRGTGAREDRTGHRIAHRDARHDQRAPVDLQPRPPGGQGPRHGCHGYRHLQRGDDGQGRIHHRVPQGQDGIRHIGGPRTSQTTLSPRASRSGRPTASSEPRSGGA